MRTRLCALAFGSLLSVLLALGGCATTRMIDSDVQSFTAAVPAVRPALYRFERLPSQGNTPAQDGIEALARVALAKVGLTPAPLVSVAISGTAAAAPSARYAVQVHVQITAILSPYSSPYYGGLWSRRESRRFGGLAMNLEPTWYRHAVRLVLRDSASGQVVFETTASFDGPWVDSAHLLPTILDAALQGYPNPPSGPRKVVIELPGEKSEEPGTQPAQQ
jgi:hypothetical protein